MRSGCSKSFETSEPIHAMPDFPSLWIGTSSPSARTLASHTSERWMVNGGAHRDEPPSIKPAAVGEPRQKADWISMQPGY
jgi:hypothetical protein